MPSKPPSICSVPGCGRACKSGKCSAHKVKAWRTTTTSAHERGYGERWRKLREMKLRANPICEVCQLAPATQVDHIKPKAKGGTDDTDNLQSICVACHRTKTSSE